MKHSSALTMALLLLLGSAPAFTAQAKTRRTWALSQFTWVKRVTAEKAAPPNQHPLRVEPETLARTLGSVRYVSGAKEKPLLEPAETVALGKILAEALSAAEPGEDLELVSTAKRDGALLSPSQSVTARLFVEGGKLNILVHDATLNLMELYFQYFVMPKYECGSRTRPGGVVLKAEGAESRRADWLLLPLEAKAMTGMIQPVAPPPAIPSASLEERLRSLKHLRDQGLITDEDYLKKKQELLKDL
jgi:hypothetical protein